MEPKEVTIINKDGEAVAKVSGPSRQSKAQWATGKGKDYFEVRVDPANRGLTRVQMAEMVGCSTALIDKLEGDDDFKAAVRQERIMRFSDNLSLVDMSMLDLATSKDNAQAAVAAGRELYKRWDPDYREKKDHDVKVSFMDLVRQVDLEERDADETD